MKRNILFFADRLPPQTGGVEMHARYFIEHFAHHRHFPLAATITKNFEGQDCLVTNEGCSHISLKKFSTHSEPAFLFFNSGRWIEGLTLIRQLFPKAIFLYRTGGNEILKAPLIHQNIPDHCERQSFWVNTLNCTIDLMITNSEFTEERLRKLGIECRFKRFVGGVNSAALTPSSMVSPGQITIFCAARFVPYKNHSLLLTVIRKLVERGCKIQVRLAGDGPLLEQAQEQVVSQNLTSIVQFLGVLDNEDVCREIASADIYMQLSKDQVTEVAGGSYIHSEGMGRSILEALTGGTFVVAGRSGALHEIVTMDKGCLVDLEDANQIADTVEQVIRNGIGRRPYSDSYCWTKIFKGYEELFGELDENIASYRKMQSK